MSFNSIKKAAIINRGFFATDCYFCVSTITNGASTFVVSSFFFQLGAFRGAFGFDGSAFVLVGLVPALVECPCNFSAQFECACSMNSCCMILLALILELVHATAFGQGWHTFR
jgi:hypothetical protein